MKIFAPTAATESFMLFLQLVLNLGMVLDFADVKSAFTQSSPLARPRGPLWVEPCEGADLPVGALVRLDVP
eukprot:675071-Alexandrium_andersonii.AAC.1